MLTAVGLPFVIAQNGSTDSVPPPVRLSPRLDADDESKSGPARSTSPEADERSASPKELRSAARAFLRLYLVGPDEHPASVPTKLHPLVTPTLWAGLKYADPRSLPTGPVTTMDVESAGPFSGMLTAELASGQTLEIAVVRWSHGWRVSDVRPEQAP
jgi:hypothetical protein